jgi:hypothetical protein
VALCCINQQGIQGTHSCRYDPELEGDKDAALDEATKAIDQMMVYLLHKHVDETTIEKLLHVRSPVATTVTMLLVGAAAPCYDFNGAIKCQAVFFTREPSYWSFGHWELIAHRCTCT